MAVLGEVMADAVDGGDEQHGAGHHIANYAGVMESTRRHTAPIFWGVLFRRLGADAQERVAIDLTPVADIEPGARQGVFEIVLG